MASAKDIIDGLNILTNSVGFDAERHQVCAEHDIIYGPNIDESFLSPNEKGKLMSLGWHWDGEYKCWAAFT